MLRSRFLWKLYAGYALLIVVAVGTVGGILAYRLQAAAQEDLRAALRARAALLGELARPALEGEEPAAELQARLGTLGRTLATRLTVIAADGTVVADSDQDPARMDNHAGRPEIQAARAHGAGEARRFSTSLGRSMLFHALPVARGGEVVGFVRTSLPLSPVNPRLAHLRGAIGLGGLASAVLALLLGLWLARRLSGPLARVTAAAEAMAAGDSVRRVPVEADDEVGQLARVLNRMADGARSQMQTIQRDRNQVLAILAGMAEGVVAVDVAERIVHLNEAAAVILRARRQGATGRRVREITRVREVSEALAAALHQGEEVSREIRLPGTSPEQVVRLHAAPLKGEGDLSTGAVAVLHDITELRRLEDVRRDFVANVSHELKTPLTAIGAMVETLLDDPEMERDTRQRFMERIRDQAARLSAMVQDLLSLSRLESSEQPLRREPVELGGLVETLAASLRPEAERRGLSLEVATGDAPLSVYGDPEALRQLAANLLDNALKYTPSGGRVTVRAGRDGGGVTLEVQDTGPGIELQHQERIFERFYRVDRGRSREVGGTGLGLSIVKHVARAHGGAVAVRSAPGQGSTFTVRLPLEGAGGGRGGD